MINLIIIEDEPAIRREISYLLKHENDVNVTGWAENVKSGVALIQEKNPDLILTDIQLHDGTAFDMIRKLDHVPENIIFITAYNQFAIKAIKYGALDYLLKPIAQNELTEAIARYRRRRDKNSQWMHQLAVAQKSLNSHEQLPESIALNSVNNIRVIKVQDIVYCQGDGPYTLFFLKNGHKELISKPLKYYEELLCAPHFLRTHQSYLVNRAYIVCVNHSQQLVLSNQDIIPISTRRKRFILDQIPPTN